MGRLADEIHAVPRSPMRAGICKIGNYLRTLDRETIEDLQFGLDSDLTSRQLSEVLARHNIAVGRSLIEEHRDKRCLCYRKAAKGE